MPVTVRGLTKRYGATLALDDVDLDLADGEIHALLGHNGAGKSTVIGCLGGGTSPTAGEMVVDGRSYAALSPRESIGAGVAVIYQHLSVVDNLTVAENLFLGQERTRAGLIRRGAQRDRARAALDRIGAHGIDPDMRLGALPIGQRQMVEIAKVLQRDARLLILDEPTAALSKDEASRLGDLIRELAGRGIAILYVTHLLGEVLKLADRATVLRNGRAVWIANRAEITRDSLVAAISDGHAGAHASPAPPRRDAEAALAVRGLTGPGLGPIDLSVAPGEIVACYGLVGSGRSRLFGTVFGRLPRTAGTVSVDGVPRNATSPRQALCGGIALVPGDRAREGLFAALGAAENTIVEASSRLGRGGFRSARAERGVFDRVAASLALRPHEPALPAGRFSGGNQQKILLGRWVNDAARTRVVLLDDPTQGVDVGARKDIYDAVKRLAADRGVGVVVATNEPEEVIDLAHRCLIFSRGRIVEEHIVADTTADRLLAAVHRTTPETRILDASEGH
ncbi:sugar ABC transporter ATP-binding protein [Microbacterium sp. EYE_5]|uniref:sugar ABC transporter ATP-binding protein n=1 Tax=unclassified Microbacterium TaxID=2609290 RepID=UPI002006C219|nr:MULTISPECIES: sugar ABC transporter ATP-binding protein [unclassified Microbacterium]MCK6081629.1 sugar ABC transporter ATP-binding protein [Microbacterium sp. EYE_382]MCK6086899.1 sugar ABC transporter ATP-binding protein [Microbacterium sp. EYE_384]MCK6123603.1 sugar ABC transporter ATP-binding protein [Microbacterium sp. EYE_80]MCK6126512.1 sugar ABC transporter ATP-binding protein [Microbacterium sp. EYE_79]MCK6142583.1 sugar ABC transporter ATP-binding protein [Microbacterium sp. EYE_3